MKKCKFLKYKLVPIKDVEFIECPQYEFEDCNFTYILFSDLSLLCKPKVDIVEELKARIIIEKMLKSWEIESGLKYGKKIMEFLHESTEMTEYNEPEDSMRSDINIKTKLTVCAEVSKRISRFPEKNNSFDSNPDMEIMWKRFEIYKDGREPLLSMAYFCLSYLEGICGSRGTIVKTYKIERKILDKLGDVSSECGSKLQARKGKDNNFINLDSDTISWVEKCILEIIKHLGKIQAIGNGKVEILKLTSII